MYLYRKIRDYMPFYNIKYVTRYRRGKGRLHGHKFEVSPWCKWKVSSEFRILKSIFFLQIALFEFSRVRVAYLLICVFWGVPKEKRSHIEQKFQWIWSPNREIIRFGNKVRIELPSKILSIVLGNSSCRNHKSRFTFFFFLVLVRASYWSCFYVTIWSNNNGDYPYYSMK